MDNNNSKDNLEDLFRKSFHNPDRINQKDGWNVPAEEVWEGIQTGLASDKKPRRKLLYWHWAAIAASFLLIISFFQLYQDAQRIKDLSNQLNENEQIVKDIKNQLETIEQSKVEQQNITAQKEAINSQPTRKNQPLNTNNTTTYSNNTTAFNKRQNFTKSFSKFDQNEPSFSTTDLEKMAVKASNNTLISSVNSIQDKAELEGLKAANQITVLAQLPTLNTSLSIGNRPIFLNTPITPVIKKTTSFYVATDYAPVWTNIQHKDFLLAPPNFFPKREQQENSFSLGLQMGILWNGKWALETGIRYLHTNNKVSHNRAIPFNFLEEQLNGQGEYESSFSMQLNSSGGAVETDVVVARSSATEIAEETELNFDITFSNSLTYLEIPFLLKREFRVGNLGLSLKAGLVNRFLIDKSFNFQQIELDDARFQFRPRGFREHANTRQQPNTYSNQYLVGFGLAYHVSPKLAIYAEPTFTRNIKPILDVGRASIIAQNKSVNVGMRYTL